MAKQKVKPDTAKSLPPDEAAFVAYLEASPEDAAAHAAYADWLEEHGRTLEAAEQRQAAGLSEVHYKLRRKSDGLFCDGRDPRRRLGLGGYQWSKRGKSWRRLDDLRAHLAAVRPGSGAYGGGK